MSGLTAAFTAVLFTLARRTAVPRISVRILPRFQTRKRVSRCRALFRAPNDWVFVSCDQAGLQDRAFAHYLAAFDDGTYARAFLSGLDPHWATAKSLMLVPTATVRDKESKSHTALREGCKSFRYGFLFGAQALRAGTILHNTPIRPAG